MQHFYDPDEWESYVIESRDYQSVQVGTRRRAPEKVAKIKADRLAKEEEEILRRADEIRARRSTTP